MKSLAMAGHLIRRLNQLSTQVFTTRVKAAGFDLTQVQFAALDAIAAHPGIDQAGVAARIAYDRATIGGVIDRLEHKGYILRTVAKHDRRARVLRLTPSGEAVLGEVLPLVTAVQDEILPGLTPAERDRFMELAGLAIRNATGADPGAEQ